MDLCLRACIAVALLALSATGCTSFFQPRSHRLMATAHQLSKDANVPAPLPRELQQHLLPPEVIGPGDVILIEPAEFNAEIRIPADQTVRPDGTIMLGSFGSLPVAWLSLDQIRDKVEETIKREMGKELRINVRLVEESGNVFYVLGSVNSPGAYPLKGNETVLDALIAAGGITDQADQGRMVLSKPTHPHDCRKVLPICYLHIVQLGDTSTNYQVESGDRIYVPSLTFWRSLSVNWIPAAEQCPRCGAAQSGCSPESILREHEIEEMRFPAEVVLPADSGSR